MPLFGELPAAGAASLTGGSSIQNKSFLAEASGMGSFVAGIKVPGTAGTMTLTTTGATMNLITLVIGAGVISLPHSIGNAGIYIGFSIIVFVAIIAIDSGRILCEAAALAEEQGFRINSFEDIATAAAGKVGMYITMAMMQVMYFLTASIFILLAGQYIGLIVDTATNHDEGLCEGVFPVLESLNGCMYGGWMIVAAVLLIPTLYLWDMSTVAKFAPAGIAGAIVLIGCMVIGSIIEMVNTNFHPPTPVITVPEDLLDATVSVFLKAIFSFAGVAAVPTMRPEMVEPEKLAGCVVKGMTIVTFAYIFVSVPAILGFGVPSDQLLADVNIVFLYLGSIGIVVHVFIALPLILNVVFNTASLTFLPIMVTRNPTSLLIRVAVLVCAFIIPMIFAKLSALLDLVSALTMLSTMIFLPLWFYWQLMARKEGSFGAAIQKIGVLPFIWQVLMLVIGALAMVLGVMQGIQELAESAPCPNATAAMMFSDDATTAMMF